MEKLGRLESYVNTGQVGSLDHYVPQLLLRKFRIAETGADKGRLFEFKFSNGQVGKVDINKAAALPGFEIFRDKWGQQSDYLTKQVYAHLLEIKGSYLIKYLNEAKQDPELTYPEESTVALFLAHQLTRTPAFRESLEKFVLYLKSEGKLRIQDLENREFMVQKIANNESNVSMDEILKFKPTETLNGGQNHWIFMSLTIADDIAKKIYGGTLHLLDIPEGSDDRFVISDNPVVLLDLERTEVLRFPNWWDIDKKELIIFLPISPKRCIFFSKRVRRDSTIENQSAEFVDIVNFGQFLNAMDSVFSHDNKVLTSHLARYQSELNKLRV